jgi:ATP-dependent DNA helicase RecG
MKLPQWLLQRITGGDGGEDEIVEFKLAAGGLPREIWPTISGFANGVGGWLVLGVKENRDGSTCVEGVTSPQKLVDTLWTQLRNREKISSSACTQDDVFWEEIAGKPVVFVRVPEATRSRKPVFINKHPYQGTFLRLGSTDQLCSLEEVNRMIREAGTEREDGSILPGTGLGDLDIASLKDYRQMFQTRRPADAVNSKDDMEFLQWLGAYTVDRRQGQEGLTMAGLLMFGTSDRILRHRPRHLIDFKAIDRTGDRWRDRLDWDGNLFRAFFLIYERLTKDLPVPFQLKDGMRTDHSPAHVALREALVNLLVHADYGEPDASVILREPDGYRFRNPGSSRVPEFELYRGHRSQPRNPKLIRMFRLVGLAEEAGSGIQNILKAWRELGYRKPDIDAGGERYEFNLDLLLCDLIGEADTEWLQQLGSEFDEAERMALVLARNEAAVDWAKLQQVADLHPADAKRVLSVLRSRGFLELQGAGVGARYVLTRLALLPGATGDKAEVGAELWQQLEAMARPFASKRRAVSRERDQLIVQLCAITPLALDELSKLLNRKKESVREAVQELVRADRLTYLYPDQITHAGQKYMVRK